MTYTEKIQLFTGLIILFVASAGYYVAKLYYIKKHRINLQSFLKIYMFAGLLIGTHQVFEFLSLHYQSQIIYKVGLLISLSGMIFYGISLETLYNKNFYFKQLGFAGLFISAVYLFNKDTIFDTLNFHLTHYSIFIWTLIWLFLLIYWNICIVFGKQNLKKYISKSVMMMYPLFTMMISFFISLSYSVYSYFKQQENICTNFPSIWCTLAFLQIIFIPVFLIQLPKQYAKQPPASFLSIKKFGQYLLATLLLTILILWLLNKNGCFNLQFIFA